MSLPNSVSGGWLGTYAYSVKGKSVAPVRFEASLQSDEPGSFRGTIIDDGALGDSTVRGEQSGATVRFTKVYTTAPRGKGANPIDYSGAMDDSGMNMSGTWTIRDRGTGKSVSGIWEARRTWVESNSDVALDEELASAAESVGGATIR